MACGDCTGGCSGRCEDNCAHGCASGCGSGCSGGCSGDCGGGCSDGCGDGCHGCGGACSSSCTGCEGGCRDNCATGCSGDCSGTCRTMCNTGCTNTTQTTAYANLSHKIVLSAEDMVNLITFINAELTRRSLTTISNSISENDNVLMSQITTLQNKLATMGQTTTYSPSLNAAILTALIDELIANAKTTYDTMVPRP